MTVASTANRIAYAGNGTTTVFSFPYYFLLTSDLLVFLTNTQTGAITQLVLNTGYTVSGTQASNLTYPNGGNVTCTVAPASGYTLTIVRNPADTQNTHWVDNDPDPAAVKETAFDKLTLLVQRAFDLLSLVPTIGDGVVLSGFSNQLPSVLTPLSTLAINANANGFTLIPAGSSGSGGGSGGGGSLFWVEDSNSPVSITEFNNLSYLFVSGTTQPLFALIKVPSTYLVGSPIKLSIDSYSPDSTGTNLISSIATLIRQGTDPMTTTTNQRTSTNNALTLSTPNVPQGNVLDITDISGKINSVSVSPGDLIKVELLRGTDTGASDVRVPVYGTSVTFS